MNTPTSRSHRIEDGFFLAIVILVTIAFALILEPFFAAVLWGVIAAILFWPVNQKLLKTMLKEAKPPTKAQLVAAYPPLAAWLESLPAEAGIL